MRSLIPLLACVSLSALAVDFNDTGIILCGGDYTDTACSWVANDDGSHPRQDARYGRDAAAKAGQLPKIGGGQAGFDFTALDASGQPTSPGSGATPHPCTRDNVTGLVWEVKTTDGGLHDQKWTYTWYDSVHNYGGKPGTERKGTCKTTDYCDTEKFVAEVNRYQWCGFSDWRMPTWQELQGIVHFGRSNPAIDPTYFPNTPGASNESFWSGSPYADGYSAWDVSFAVGSVYYPSRSNSERVRLVRGGGQSVAAFALAVNASGSGSGNIASNSGGIYCTSTAGATSGSCSASFASGSAVTLTASPASGHTFSGWSGACTGTSPSCSLTMDAGKSVSAGFNTSNAPSSRYSKMANNGSLLSASAVLGSGATQWACTRDNTTGLIWEVKTTDNGLRDWSKTYTNYDDPSQIQKWNGSTYVIPSQAEINAASNSIGFVNAVNASALCGSAAWRRPNKDELLTLVDTAYLPTINPTYFPNTESSYFWSSSPGTGFSHGAWDVYFYYGNADGYSDRNYDRRVRLVRSGP